MAGDWIKIEKATCAKPEVLRIAAALSMPVDQALGLCVRFWCWCDDQLMDGHAPGVTNVTLDGVFGCAGFASALVNVGWLTARNGSLSVPNFDRHLSENAKKRALSGRRQARKRVTQTSRSQRDKNVTREEKRRDIHTASAVCVGDTPQPPSDPPVVDTPAKSQPPPKPRAFAPPTVDEVRAYVAELKANVDADRFVDFYASKGWMVGKNQMRDWKAAVRTWARSEDGSIQTAIRASAGGTSAGPAGGSREQQRENANNAAIAGFLQRRGVRAGDGGADHAEANRSVHGEGTGRLALRLEAVPSPDPERGGGGTGNVGNAVPRGGGPVPPVSAEDAAGVLPKPGR